MLVDLHIHGMAHGELSHSPQSLMGFIQWAEKRCLAVMGFAEHDWFLEDIDFQLIRQLQGSTPVQLRVGVEVDHRPGKRLPELPFDYRIGSVHEINGFLFDHPDYLEVYRQWDPDDLYTSYFELLEDLITCGCYDIVGHFDLIKVFGCRPKKSITKVVTDLLQLAKMKDLVVEVNTAGKYKPIGEIYPDIEILRVCKALEVPITLGSDAHLPDHVGRDLALQADHLVNLGFKEIVSFKNRVPELHSLI